MDPKTSPCCARSPSYLISRLRVNSPAPGTIEDATPRAARRDSEDASHATSSPTDASRARLSSRSSHGLRCDTTVGATPYAPPESASSVGTPSLHSVQTGFRTLDDGDELPEPEQTDSPVTKRSRRVFSSSERPAFVAGVATSYGHEGYAGARARDVNRQERGRSMTEVYAVEDGLAHGGSTSDLSDAMRAGWDRAESPLVEMPRQGRPLSTQLPSGGPQLESPTADAHPRDRVRPRPREGADTIPSVGDAVSALVQAASPGAPVGEIPVPPPATASSSASSSSSSPPTAMVTPSQAGFDADVASVPAIAALHSPARPGLCAVMEEGGGVPCTVGALEGEEEEVDPAVPTTPGPALHADLPADFSPGCPTHDASQRPVLPTVEDPGHHDLKSVDGATVKNLIEGRFPHVNRYIIFDCRYKFEYEGGHIKHAVSTPEPAAVTSMLFESPPEPNETVVLLFHCEYSQSRGPTMMRQMREYDRRINSHRYPCLHYPQMFLIHRGYRQVFADVPTICEGSYRPMDAPEFTEECRDSRSFVRSSRRRWQRTIAGRGLRARRAVSAMQRTQSDPTGENSARAGARSVALISRFDDEDEDVGSGFTRRPQPLHRAVSDGLFSQHLERAAAQASDEEPEECGKEDAREVDLLQPPRE